MSRRKSRGRGVDATGRSKRSGGFLMLDHGLLDSDAWRGSTPAMRAFVTQVARRYHGANNGALPFGIRDAVEECRIAPNTAVRARAEAMERGFLECAEAGGFNRKDKHATRWRLTWKRCDVTGALPSRAFASWKLTVAKCATDGSRSKNRTRSQDVSTTVARCASQTDETAATVAKCASENGVSDHSTVSKCASVSRYIPQGPDTLLERLAAMAAMPPTNTDEVPI